MIDKLTRKLSTKNAESILSLAAILYFMFGVLFALCFAWYYKWPTVGYFSPGFYVVIFTWPFQTTGFIRDILYYGLSGKPI